VEGVSTPATHSPHFGLDATAQLYRDVQLPHIFDPWARVLLELQPPRPGDRVLDVATGPGTVARQAAVLAGPEGHVTGVDVSPAMLGVARAWRPQDGAAPIEYIESSAAEVPLPDSSFDVAYCQQGLQHMTEPEAALREMWRLLKPGGRMAIAAWTSSPFQRFRQIVGQLVPNAGGHRPSDFGRDAAALKGLLAQLGFGDVQVQTRQLVSTFEGGVSQALRLAEGTSVGPVLATLSEAQRAEVRAALTAALEQLASDGVVRLPSEANIATARR